MRDVLLLDLRAGARALRRTWLAASLVVAGVALSAATAAALFSPIDAMFLRQLPFGAPDRLHLIASSGAAARPSPDSISPEMVRAFASRSDVLEGISAFAPGPPFDATPVEAEREALVGAGVDPSFAPVMQVQPAVGRPLLASDATTGPGQPVLISWDLWRTRFGGDPAMLNRDVVLGGARVVVVGVMPARFDFPNGTNVWALRHTPAQMDRFWHLLAVVRLREGISPEVAADALGFARDPDQTGRRQLLWPIAESIAPAQALTLWLFMCAAAVTFAIAWMQLAGVQLAALTRRRPELAVRRALGASRRHVVWAASLDGILLAVLAAGAGAAALPAVASLFAALLPPEVVAASVPRADVRSMAFLFALCAAAGSALAWAMARALARDDLTPGHAPDPPRRMRQLMLTAAQAAVTGVLLYVTLLLTVSFMRLHQQTLEFSPRGLYVVTPQVDYATPARIKPAMAALEEAARQVPGVRSAAVTDADPMGTGGLARTVRTATGSTSVRWRVVGAGYLQTIGGRMAEGRWFEQTADRAGRLVVVNETFARQAAFGESMPSWVHDSLFRFDVIGVVRDMRNVSAQAPPEPEVYALADASIFSPARLVVRADASPDVMARLREAASAAFPGSGEPRVRAVDEILRVQQAPVRTRAQLLLVFSAVALMLSLIGTYASVAHLAVTRRRELAMRASLGASPSRLRREVMMPTLWAAGAGALAACAAGFWIAQGLRAYLFGVSEAALWVPALVCATLIGSGVAAGILPARRAASVNPAEALRY